MKEWQKILAGLVCVVGCFFLIDFLVGTASEKMYNDSKYGIFHRQIYCMEESEDDVLVLGSSRAAHHYVPQVFADSLGMNCYNCGSDGMCIYYHYAILSSYLRRGAVPKVVLYDVMALDARESNSATFCLGAALDRLAPHYGQVPEIDSLFALNGWKEKVKLLSKTYRYNSKAVQTIKCNFIPWPEDRGYEALNGTLNVDLLGPKPTSVPTGVIEPDKLVYVQKLIDACKASGIRLYFLYSPYYRATNDYGIELVKEMAGENGVPFWDFHQNELFADEALFHDIDHLNDVGARAYSQMIAGLIKNDLSQ